MRQLSNGHILLMDDGGTRPNCTCNADDCDAASQRCYSRAVEYALDFDARTATLVWSFAFPVSGGTDAEPTASIGALERSDVFLYDGGSVYREVSHVETTTSCCHSRMSHRSSRERCRAGLLHVGLSRERRVVSPCNR